MDRYTVFQKSVHPSFIVVYLARYMLLITVLFGEIPEIIALPPKDSVLKIGCVSPLTGSCRLV